MDEKSKWFNVLLVLNILKEAWEAFSDKPIVQGIFEMFNLDSASAGVTVVSKYWLLILSAIVLIWWNYPTLRLKIFGLEKIVGKRFTNRTVVLDGKEFVNCIFENCTIEWRGGTTSYTGLKRIGPTHFQFRGNKQVVMTINFLKTFHALDATFSKSIRNLKSDEVDKGDPIDNQ